MNLFNVAIRDALSIIKHSLNPHGGLTPNRREEKRREEKARKHDSVKQLSDFLDYFNRQTGKQYTLTPERKRVIEQRLKTHSLGDLMRAVDNFVKDDWSERDKYTDVIYCIGIRNKVDNLEKWLNYQAKGSHTQGAIDKITNIDKAKRLLKRDQITDSVVRCYEDLPKDIWEELVNWILNEGSHLKPVFGRAMKLIKKRATHG